ncbi:MAG: helix-hairpin-helix domain-containing protein [Eubacteriales bacterium]|nr:helix-hairpin-helix domain-containing protein [Eubacteriales bacterium]
MSKSHASKKLALFLITTSLFSALAMWSKFQSTLPDTSIIIHANQEVTSNVTENNPSGTQLADSDGTQLNNTHLADANVEQLVDQIPIYLVGAIQNPGIYQVARGSYLYQLIERAGGLTSEAAAKEIDLAMQINENGRIQIPTQTQFSLNPNQNWLLEASSEETEKININQATLDQLDTLPGIGPATAKSIIDYRERNGPFSVLEDLMKVPGIKQSRLDAMADLISID